MTTMKSSLLLLFVSASSAFVLYDSGEESLLSTEIMDSGNRPKINYLTSDDLPWVDDRLFYRLLKFHKNNTTEQDVSTENALEKKALKAAEIKRLKSNKQTDNNLSYNSARKWYFKKGKGVPTLCFFKICSFKTIQW